MTIKHHKFEFDYKEDEKKIVYMWIIDGDEMFKLVHYIDDEPAAWESEWGLEIPEIYALFDTEGLIKYSADIKTMIEDMQNIILEAVVDDD